MEQPDSSNPMRDQVFSLPDLIREQIWTLEARTRKIIATPEMYATRHIILTGCGDSFISGMAAEAAFIELAGIHTQALPAMQASRYAPHSSPWQYPRNPLVLAVSNSGEVARVVEAVKHYAESNALTVAITGNPDSRLANAAERVIEVVVPPFASAPGVRSYVISLLTLYLLAIRFGEARGNYTMDEAMAMRQELEAAADSIANIIESVDTQMRELADTWHAFTHFELLGSGADRATAAYGAAKLLEAVGVHAGHQDIEEWVHLEYFVANARSTGTFVICPPGSPALSRVVEIEALLQQLERPYFIIGGENTFKQVITLGGTIRAVFAPLLYSVPLALFAAHLSQRVDAQYGRGATGQWAGCKDGMTTRNSAIQ